MYNVFEYIGPLKATDKAFDIGITTYFSMLDILLTVLTNKLKELLPRQSLLSGNTFSIIQFSRVTRRPSTVREMLKYSPN